MRFHVENCQHADQKQLTRRQAFDLDVEETHGQPGSCRARPVKVDDGLEDIRCIRGLGGEQLPVASYALLPNLKKGLLFAIGEGSRIFVACFLNSNAQICLYQTPSRRPPRTTGRFCEHCDQRVGRSPKRARPVQISWHSRWFGRSMSGEDSESRRFELTLG